MNPILDALSRAFRDLFQFQVLWVVIWPVFAATLLWLVLGAVFWNTFSGWLASGLAAIGIESWFTGVEPRWIAYWLQALLHLLLFVPLVFLSALLFTALFAMPGLIRLVANRDYPQLWRENGGNLAGNLLNVLFALLIFLAIWVLGMTLWFVGAAFLAPFIATAYLNQRLFRYDALAEHASPAEMQELFAKHNSAWWALGLLTGILQFVPLLNLFAAPFAALAFIHFGLARLAELRQEPYASTGFSINQNF